MGLEAALWRAVSVYRLIALLYAAIMITKNFRGYEHPAGGWIVLAVMTVWTAYVTYAYSDALRSKGPLLVADLAVATGCLLSTAWIESRTNLIFGQPTIPVSWVAAVILAWSVVGCKRLGITAAAVLAAAGILVHVIAGSSSSLNRGSTLNGIVLLLMAGLVVGHVVKLARDAEARLARAVELESTYRERERLARRIHDSVLQVLAMVQRRGNEMGGEAAELGRLAGEQEAALRALIGSGLGSAPPPPPSSRGSDRSAAAGDGAPVDVRAVLTGHSSTTVTVSTPATPVYLPGHAAGELGAAVAAALDNVREHGGDGARAWVLLEDGPGPEEVTVSVRDDGPGMEPGRLAQAAADGRLGVAQSIQGRVRDLGGTVSIISAPGEGTEIEMTVPVPG